MHFIVVFFSYITIYNSRNLKKKIYYIVRNTTAVKKLSKGEGKERSRNREWTTAQKYLLFHQKNIPYQMSLGYGQILIYLKSKLLQFLSICSLNILDLEFSNLITKKKCFVSPLVSIFTTARAADILNQIYFRNNAYKIWTQNDIRKINRSGVFSSS